MSSRGMGLSLPALFAPTLASVSHLAFHRHQIMANQESNSDNYDLFSLPHEMHLQVESCSGVIGIFRGKALPWVQLVDAQVSQARSR